jgi:hypothetical protein
MPRPIHRAVLILEMPFPTEPNVASYIADDEGKKLPPMTGPKSPRKLGDWFASGWFVHTGSGFPQRPATDNDGIGKGAVDRAVLILQHD